MAKKKILRVNMGTGKCSVEGVSKEFQLLGGRGLTSILLFHELSYTCHALSPENKIVFAPGLLTGMTAPCSGRLSIGAKSPLTGGIKETNVGGTASQKIARLGYAAIVVEGAAEEGRLYYLMIGKREVALHSADEWRGLGNYDVVARIHEKYGNDVSTITIGYAGELKFSSATVAVSDIDGYPSRHAGRGGIGAVMGSKGLKAIVLDGSGTENLPLVDPQAFRSGVKKLVDAIKESPVTSKGLPEYGTAVILSVINEAGGLPTRNFSVGRFEGADKISGEQLRTTLINQRKGTPTHSCQPGCIINCSNIYCDAQGNYLTAGLEYETIALNGSNLGIESLDTIANISRLCDDIGIDTIETGVSIGVAMEAGLKKFGDGPGAIELIKEIGKGTPLGRILGNGAAVTGQVFGIARTPVVKRQGLPGYDPRAIKGIGVTYATSAMGADHTSGYAIATNIMNIGGSLDPLAQKGQIELSRNFQIVSAAFDSTGLCLMVIFAILEIPKGFEGVIEMINAAYGLSMSRNDFNFLGLKILETERKFNEIVGFTKAHDRLPEFFQKEKLKPLNSVFDISDESIDSFFNF